MKTKLIAGNWKMNGSIGANDALLRAIIAGMPAEGCAVAVCVPAPYFAQLQVLRQGSALELGAQDVSQHEQGAYTGEVSAAMLKEFGVRYTANPMRSWLTRRRPRWPTASRRSCASASR
jgi:triosephosphate isomerase